MGDKIKLIGGIFGLVGAVISGFLFLDSRSHKIATETVAPVVLKLSALDKRMTLNELKDLLRQAQEELLFWKKQQRKYPNDEDVKEELKKAEEHVKEIKERIKELEKKEEENA